MSGTISGLDPEAGHPWVLEPWTLEAGDSCWTLSCRDVQFLHKGLFKAINPLACSLNNPSPWVPHPVLIGPVALPGILLESLQVLEGFFWRQALLLLYGLKILALTCGGALGFAAAPAGGQAPRAVMARPAVLRTHNAR